MLRVCGQPYFDTFRYTEATWGCGSLKTNVLQSGKLRTSASKTLEFGQPLDNVLDTLLSWFHSHYAVQEYTTYLEERQRASPTSPTPASSAPPALLQPDDESDDDGAPVERLAEVQATKQNWKRPRADTTNSDVSTASVDHDDSRHARPAVVPTQEQYQLAVKVKTHDEFMRLLDDALTSKQKNRRDPKGDRYPKNRKHHGGDNIIRLDRSSALFVFLGRTVPMKRKPLKRKPKKRAKTEQAKTTSDEDEDEDQEDDKTRNKDKDKNSAIGEDRGQDDDNEGEDDDGDDGGDRDDGDEEDEESEGEDSKDEDYEDEDYEDADYEDSA